MPKHYVNNKSFYESLVEYKEKISKETNSSSPKIPKYVGECILLICNRLSFRPNFINYTYKDDMVADAIENCILAIDSFNPEKSANPFAYFTQIAYFAFLRRIAKEKKQEYIRNKMFKHLMVDQMYGMEFSELMQNDNEHTKFSSEIISSFEEKNLNKPKKKKPQGLEKIMDIENE